MSILVRISSKPSRSERYCCSEDGVSQSSSVDGIAMVLFVIFCFFVLLEMKRVSLPLICDNKFMLEISHLRFPYGTGVLYHAVYCNGSCPVKNCNGRSTSESHTAYVACFGIRCILLYPPCIDPRTGT
jgi:hypothetical protein